MTVLEVALGLGFTLYGVWSIVFLLLQKYRIDELEEEIEYLESYKEQWERKTKSHPYWD